MKKYDWFTSDAIKQITFELCSPSLSIDKMSLHEIHSNWEGQQNDHNIVTNYKRLQKKVKTQLSLQSIDSNNPDKTLLNPQISTKKSCRKQDSSKHNFHYPVIPKKLPQWKTTYCLTYSILHELYMMPNSKIHLIDTRKSTNHVHYSADIHLMNSISIAQR